MTPWLRPRLAPLLAAGLLLAGCTGTATPAATSSASPSPTATSSASPSPTATSSASPSPTATPSAPPSPTAKPTSPSIPPSPTPTRAVVDGWTGTLVKHCSMAQFDDYFQRDDGQGYGIEGTTPDLRTRLESLHCQPGARLQVWGWLETETMDSFGTRIVVERLAVHDAPPTPTPAPAPGPEQEPVESWVGRVVPFCGAGGLHWLFERQDGVRFGIRGGTDAARDALYIAECEGYPVRVWGTLHRGADDYGGTRIVVERLEKG